MASILSKHSMGNATLPDRYFSKFVRRYRAFISLLKEIFSRKSPQRKEAAFSTKGNIYMLQEPGKTEEELLTEQSFSNEEISNLLKLREHYQNGGSDREFMIRYLRFLKYLHTRDQLSS